MRRHRIEFRAREDLVELAAVGKLHRHTSLLFVGQRFTRRLDGNRQTLFVRGRQDVGVKPGPEFFDGPANQPVIEIVTAERRIAAGGKHFEDTLGEVQKRYVKRTAAEVINQVLALGAVVQTVSQGCSCGFVEKTQNIKTGEFGGVLRCLTLRVVEIRRNRNHGAHEFRTHPVFGAFAQHLQNFGGNFHRTLDALSRLDTHHAGGVFKVIRNNDITRDILHAAPHQTLDGADGVQGIGRQVRHGVPTDGSAFLGQITHDGGQEKTPFIIGQHFRCSV